MQLIDLEPLALRWRYQNPEQLGLFFTVHFSPNHRLLAVGAYSGKVHLLDVKSGRRVHVLSEHSGTVSALAFFPDGKHLVSGGMDGLIKVWDIRSELLVAEYGPFHEEIKQVHVLDANQLQVLTASHMLYTFRHQPIL